MSLNAACIEVGGSLLSLDIELDTDNVVDLLFSLSREEYKLFQS